MLIYADTSSLAKIYLEEAGADTVRELLETALAVATTALAYVEAVSAFSRRQSDGDLSSRTGARLRAALDSDWPSLLILDSDYRRAADLAAKHYLRAFDAVHLAAALGLGTAVRGATVTFLSHDRQLREAARGEGLEVIPATM